MTDGIDDLLWLPAGELRAAIRGGEVSAREILDCVFRRIDDANPSMNFFCALNREEAYAAAQDSDRRRRTNVQPRPLEGLPVAVKDITPTKGLVTTMGSKVFKDFVPHHDAVIVERLRRAGAVLVGKTTTSEFANASVTESPLTGVTRNPWDLGRTSGGSSGGSAVAVATGCVPLAEGSDMGGSVRIPACFCGLVGLKPSFGRIPFGISPNVFDPLAHHGPISRNVRDAALFLSVTAGPDNRDPLSLPATAPGYHRHSLAGMRIAFSRNFDFVAVETDVIENLEATLIRAQEQGAHIEEVAVAFNDDLYEAGLHIFSAEITGSYGHLAATHREILDPTLLRFFDVAAGLSAVDLVKAHHVRTRYWNTFRTVFDVHDAFLCPTMPRQAPPIGVGEFDFNEKTSEGFSIVFDMTMPFNLFGPLPAVTIPSGLGQEGLPTGLQIVANRHDEATALVIADALHDPILWTQRLKSLRSGEWK